MTPRSPIDEARWRRAALVLLVGGSLFHVAYVALGPLALAPDEAHYWEWSRRLDWSYYSKGPMVAWLIAGSTTLLGTNELGVRMPAILLGLGTGLLGMRIATDLFASERAAFFTVALLASMPLYAAGSMLMTIDPPFVFCWALGAWTLWRATNGPPAEARRWWALCGVAIGLGVLAKYTMALFVPAGALAVAASGARRRVRAVDVALALAITGVCSAPIVWWNACHDWVSLRHVIGQTGLGPEGGARSLRTVADFAGSQIGVVSPGIIAAMAVAAWRFFGGARWPRREAHAFLLSLSLPLVAFFFAWSFHSKVEANWPAPAWLPLAIAVAADWDARRIPRRRAWIALAIAPGVLLVALAHVAPALDLPHRLDPTGRLRGWRALGATVGDIERKAGSPAIAAATYQMASELAFYVPSRPRVFNLDLGARRQNQYDVWGGNETLVGRDLLLVIEGSVDPSQLAPLCERAEARAVDTGRGATIFLCFGARADVARAGASRY